MFTKVPLKQSLNFLKQNKERMFWAWMAYQAIKGTITLTVIWIPLFLVWKNHGGLKQLVPDWGHFMLANFLFFAGHIVLLQRGARGWLTTRIGHSGFWSLFTVISACLFGWSVYEALHAPRVVLWAPQVWQVIIALILIFAGVWIAALGCNIANPLSAFGRDDAFDPEQPGILSITRHPVLWGIWLWGVGHVLANGELPFVIFFGAQALFAFFGIRIIDWRKKKQLGGERWHELAQHTSFLFNPFALFFSRFRQGQSSSYWLKRTGIAVAIFLIVLILHPVLIGISPLMQLGWAP